ncbi:MAG: protein-L-isoaspartate O-methyltransferase [Minwuia sp.]|nr:protein-L-isoaspartate O-methyltransferase [Minwuia sp.]
MDFQAARRAMVDSQLRPNRLTDERIATAMLSLPREEFLPKALSGVAYVDEDIPLGKGRYMMEPMVLGRLLQYGEIGPEDTVLHVGCGTGYASAVMAMLAGTVVALESDEDLVARATDLLAEQQVANAAVVAGDLAAGLADQGPYDLVMIEGAVAEVPQALIDQVAEGGRLLAVVRNKGVGVATIYRRENGVVGHRELFDAATPILPGFEARKRFVF